MKTESCVDKIGYDDDYWPIMPLKLKKKTVLN